MAIVGRIMRVEDQTNEWIITELVKAELKMHEAPVKRDRRKMSDLEWAIAEHRIKRLRAELHRRRNPEYVAARNRLIQKTFQTDETGIEVVTL